MMDNHPNLSALGIIGGIDGSTAIFLLDKDTANAPVHTAFSAIHFEPAEDIEWRMEFREKLMEDAEIELIRSYQE